MISAAAARRMTALFRATISAQHTILPGSRALAPAASRLDINTSITRDAKWNSSSSIDITVIKSDNLTPQDHASPPIPSKSSDQIIEEQILSLQSELRTHHRSANYTTALETASQLLDMSQSHFGKLHPATASAYNNVGLMNKCLGHYIDAKQAYEEALRIYGEVCGKDHGSYAAALSNLGMLERGRVLEVDSEEEDGDTESSASEVEEDYNQPVTPAKTKLSTLDRLQLNEVAIEYFDEAYRIRLAELGPTHPHTVASRSQLGSAMAYSVIMERRNKLSSAAGKGGLIEKELRNMKHQLAVENEEELKRHIPLAVARAASKSMETSSQLSRRRWDAAQEHLRGALETAVTDPRGESVRPLQYLPGKGGAINGNDVANGLFVKDRSLPKKDRRKAAKEAKREKRQDVTTSSNIAIEGAAGKVTTLTGATAAQNLAVFLKNYSDWLQLSLMDDDSKSNTEQQPKLQYQKEQQLLHLNSNIQEARHLYEAALHVRCQLLPPHHPDVVATKFSLAELLDASKEHALEGLKSGSEEDRERANALREEILSAYNVEEKEIDTAASTS
jgi:tetratricopeptide (TPR) repeat protein